MTTLDGEGSGVLGPLRPRRWPRVLLGLLLVAVGASVHVTGASLPGASSRVVGQNRPVNMSAYDKRDFSAHNSPTIAQNPVQAANLVVVNRVDTPRFACSLHVSVDGGATWRDSRIPFPEGEEQPPRCFSPDVVFTGDGTAHVSFLTLAGLGNTPNALWVTSSADGGLTLATPQRVAGPLAFQARIAASPGPRGPLHLSWLQGTEVGTLSFPTTDNPIVVSTSSDGGRTWTPPVRVNPAKRDRVVAPSLAVGTDEALYVSYLDLGEDALDYHGAHEGIGGDPYAGRWQLVLARSEDKGRSWSETVVEDRLVPAERFIVFFPPSPSLAVDRESGRIYVGFHDSRLGDPDVWVWRSTDRGASFSRPVRVNDTPKRDGTAQYLPKVSVALAGRVDVVYYDKRNDTKGIMVEASLQSSGDGGASFRPRLQLSDTAFDARIGFGSERGMPDLGSRLGLVSADGAAMAVWSDTRAGTQGSNKQDIASAVVAFKAGSTFRTPLRATGVATAAGGAVFAAWALLSRRREGRGKISSDL